MCRQSDSTALIRQARTFLLERETRLLNARRNAFERNSQTESDQPFQRTSSKRKSFSQSFSSMFGKRPSQVEASFHLSPSSQEVQNCVHPKFNEAQHVALCAVLLDEWVKELAALAQEHTIAQLATLFE